MNDEILRRIKYLLVEALKPLDLKDMRRNTPVIQITDVIMEKRYAETKVGRNVKIGKNHNGVWLLGEIIGKQKIYGSGC